MPEAIIDHINALLNEVKNILDDLATRALKIPL